MCVSYMVQSIAVFSNSIAFDGAKNVEIESHLLPPSKLSLHEQILCSNWQSFYGKLFSILG